MISEQCNISTGTVNTHMRHIYKAPREVRDRCGELGDTGRLV
ncbi:MAG: hypothetical protein IPO87_06405 [Flavobacteriales bacterium]|nr:hypothetical protein [Flavobacteriales bacterium]